MSHTAWVGVMTRIPGPRCDGEFFDYRTRKKIASKVWSLTSVTLTFWPNYVSFEISEHKIYQLCTGRVSFYCTTHLSRFAFYQVSGVFDWNSSSASGLVLLLGSQLCWVPCSHQKCWAGESQRLIIFLLLKCIRGQLPPACASAFLSA